MWHRRATYIKAIHWIGSRSLSIPLFVLSAPLFCSFHFISIRSHDLCWWVASPFTFSFMNMYAKLPAFPFWTAARNMTMTVEERQFGDQLQYYVFTIFFSRFFLVFLYTHWALDACNRVRLQLIATSCNNHFCAVFCCFSCSLLFELECECHITQIVHSHNFNFLLCMYCWTVGLQYRNTIALDGYS